MVIRQTFIHISQRGEAEAGASREPVQMMMIQIMYIMQEQAHRAV